jgi:RNA polymerase sigma-70 factor (ECF subfamily)
MKMLDLDVLYREHADTVHRYLLVKTNSADLAEELTQETFYQALRSVDSYDGSCKFSTWLIGIAKNVLRTHWRKLRQQPTVSLEDAPELTSGSAEESVLSGTELEAVLGVIHRLEEPGREVLYLRLLGSLSFRQIGDVLGQSETWARVTYYRAKQSVVKELKRDEA